MIGVSISNTGMTVQVAPPRPVDELQRLQAAKLRELSDVQSELETARWIQEYDAAELYRPGQR